VGNGFEMARVVALALCIGASASHGIARADDRDVSQASPLHQGEIGLGADAGMSFGDTCYRDGDVEGCQAGMGLAGFQASAHYRLSGMWSLGAGGSFAWGSGPRDTLTSWLLEAQARLHPFGMGSVDPSIGAGAGLVTLHAANAADPPTFGSSTTKVAPEIGLRLAVDFRLASGFLLGPELHGFLLLFHGTESLAQGATSFATQPGVALAVNATLVVGPTDG
jgi:hypothetical protein